MRSGRRRGTPSFRTTLADQRLTVNLGVRWEYNGLINSRYGNLTNVWPSEINTVPIPGSTPATGTLAGFVVPPITIRR